MLAEEGLFGQLLAEKYFLANAWPKSPFWPTVGRKVPFRPTEGRWGDTFDFSALGCIVSKFAIKIIIVSKKTNIVVSHFPFFYKRHERREIARCVGAPWCRFL